MTDELKPVRCGCGGEVAVLFGVYKGHEYYIAKCWGCGTQTVKKRHKAEAIQTWNRAMGSTEKSSVVERTAKVIEHDASVTDTDGYKYQRSEYLCENCKKRVIGGDDYCSHCGCRLDWNEDIPMEYFENGGI